MYGAEMAPRDGWLPKQVDGAVNGMERSLAHIFTPLRLALLSQQGILTFSKSYFSDDW